MALENTTNSCAACGKVNNNPKTCTACKTVKYCNTTCQKEHRPHHKNECKKRAAELHDTALFQQPSSPNNEDCPICFLPLPLHFQTLSMECCGKTICCGCAFANTMATRSARCPFCRELAPSDKDLIKRLKDRVANNDANACYHLGRHYMNGTMGLPMDLNKTAQLLFRSIKLGSTKAHFDLGCLYHEGQGGVERNLKKAKYHLEMAAIAGNEEARYNLGRGEQVHENRERALKHWRIAAMAGHDPSMKEIKKGLDVGDVTREEYEVSLRGYIVSVKGMKSVDRDKAAAVGMCPGAR